MPEDRLDQALIDALTRLYPERDELKALVRRALGQTLDQVASNAKLPDQIDELVTYVESRGRYADLVRAAHGGHPGDLALRALHQRLLPDEPLLPAPGVEEHRLETDDDAYLRCDRTNLWKDLGPRTGDPRAHPLILCGKKEDGHAFFLDAVRTSKRELGVEVIDVGELLLAVDGARAVGYIGDALERARPSLPALAPIADVRRNLAAAIARLLEERSLILLYPLVNAREHVAWLLAHHAVAIPALYEEARRHAKQLRGALITLQPIFWTPRLWDRIERLSNHKATHDALAPSVTPKAAPSPLNLLDFKPIEQGEVDAFIREVYKGHAQAIDEGIHDARVLLDLHPDPIRFFPSLREQLLNAAARAQRQDPM